jgi:hypothetical protein
MHRTLSPAQDLFSQDRTRILKVVSLEEAPTQLLDPTQELLDLTTLELLDLILEPLVSYSHHFIFIITYEP